MGIEELIAIAKRRGLSAISVTDHDTTAAATRAVIIGRRQEVRVIHVVEFSTIDKVRGNEAHLLCYLCDTPDRLEGLCRRTGESRRQAAMAMVRKVMRYYPITPELIVKCATGSTNIYKQHIMHALMDAGYADSIYGELYQKLFSPETGSALVEPEYPDVKEVLELIHSAGGIAVLAHPVPYRNEELLEELLRDHRAVVTLEDGSLDGGFGEKIARRYGPTPMRVLNYGLRKEFADRYDLGELLRANRLTGEQIAEDVLRIVR